MATTGLALLWGRCRQERSCDLGPPRPVFWCVLGVHCQLNCSQLAHPCLFLALEPQSCGVSSKAYAPHAPPQRRDQKPCPSWTLDPGRAQIWGQRPVSEVAQGQKGRGGSVCRPQTYLGSVRTVALPWPGEHRKQEPLTTWKRGG